MVAACSFIDKGEEYVCEIEQYKVLNPDSSWCGFGYQDLKETYLSTMRLLPRRLPMNVDFSSLTQAIVWLLGCVKQ